MTKHKIYIDLTVKLIFMFEHSSQFILKLHDYEFLLDCCTHFYFLDKCSVISHTLSIISMTSRTARARKKNVAHKRWENLFRVSFAVCLNMNIFFLLSCFGQRRKNGGERATEKKVNGMCLVIPDAFSSVKVTQCKHFNHCRGFDYAWKQYHLFTITM